MIVSHSKKFIYFHIPKTGGSSISWNLIDYISSPYNNIDQIEQKPGWQRLTHFDQKQHSSYSENILFCESHNDYFKFAFIRNPWDLTLSWFLATFRDYPDKITPTNFKYFLLNYLETYNPFLNPIKFFKKYSFRGYRALNRNQLSYVSDSQNVIKVDYIARFEKYDKEMNFILEKLNIKNINKEKVNVANFWKIDYKDFYDKEGKNIIYKLFYDDINAFNYKY